MVIIAKTYDYLQPSDALLEVAGCEPTLHRIVSVQECDARMVRRG